MLAYGPDAMVRTFSQQLERDSRILRGVIAVLLLVLTASIGARHFGARAGWFSAGVLVTCFSLPHAVRADGTQLLSTLLAWLGAAGLADAIFRPRRGLEVRLIFAYAALGLAFVTGGLLPALWPLGGLALYLGLKKRPASWNGVHIGAGLAIIVGLAIPWYGAMTERYGAEFLRHAPFFPYAAEPRGSWFAGPVIILSFLVLGLFPWSALLPGAILHAATWWRRGGPAPEVRRAKETEEEHAAHFYIAMLAGSLAPLLFYPTPPLTAVLPAAPAAALLCGRLLDHAYEDAERVAGPIARAAGMLALVGTLTAIMVAFAATPIRGASAQLRELGAALFITSWAPFLANFAGRRLLAAMLLALPVAVGTPLTTLRVLPAMENYLSARAVAATMESAAPPRATLVLLEPPPPTLRLYGEHNLVEADSLAVTLREQRAPDGLAYLAFRPDREREVARRAGVPIEVLLRTPVLVLARVGL